MIFPSPTPALQQSLLYSLPFFAGVLPHFSYFSGVSPYFANFLASHFVLLHLLPASTASLQSIRLPPTLSVSQPLANQRYSHIVRRLSAICALGSLSSPSIRNLHSQPALLYNFSCIIWQLESWPHHSATSPAKSLCFLPLRFLLVPFHLDFFLQLSHTNLH